MKTVIQLVIGDREFQAMDVPEGTEITDKVSITSKNESTGQILLMDFEFILEQKDDSNIVRVYGLTYAYSVSSTQAETIGRMAETKKDAT